MLSVLPNVVLLVSLDVLQAMSGDREKVNLVSSVFGDEDRSTMGKVWVDLAWLWPLILECLQLRLFHC